MAQTKQEGRDSQGLALERLAEVSSGERGSAFAARRHGRQAMVWWVLFAIIIAGWWYPILGFFVPACMFAAWGIAVARGRSWCDWMCPRGAFHDYLLSRASTGGGIPAVLRSMGFRVFMLMVLMTVLAIRLPQAWPHLDRIGLVFVMLLTATTAVAILVGVIFHPRSWCLFCPAGTVANWLGRGRPPRLLINDSLCTECKRCFKVCPVQLRPFGYRRQGLVSDADCLKCGLCVEACKTQALTWKEARG